MHCPQTIFAISNPRIRVLTPKNCLPDGRAYGRPGKATKLAWTGPTSMPIIRQPSLLHFVTSVVGLAKFEQVTGQVCSLKKGLPRVASSIQDSPTRPPAAESRLAVTPLWTLRGKWAESVPHKSGNDNESSPQNAEATVRSGCAT